MALTCPHCGHPNFATAKICRRCRKDISDVCGECGQPKTAGATFCSHCGSLHDIKIDTEIYKKPLVKNAPPTDASGKKTEPVVLPVKGVNRTLKKCPECFHKIDDAALFCIYCGYVFDPVIPTPAAPPTPVTPEPVAKPAPVTAKPGAKPAPAAGTQKAPAPTAPRPRSGAEESSKTVSTAKKPGEGKTDPTSPPAAKSADKEASTPPPRPVRSAPPTQAADETPTPPPRPKPAAIHAVKAEEPIAAASSVDAIAEPPPAPDVSPASDNTSIPAVDEPTPERKTTMFGRETGPVPLDDEVPEFDPKKNAFMDLELDEVDLEGVPGLVPMTVPPDYTPLDAVEIGAGRFKVASFVDMVPVGGGLFPVNANGRAVELRPFLIDRFPVTNEEYRSFVDAAGVEPPPDWVNGHCVHGMDRYPVTSVSFQQAQAFARWAGKRLPTALEWEKAAGGNELKPYPWGNEWDGSRAHFDAERGCLENVDAHPTGASEVGCLDFLGNACEWTVDPDRSEPLLKGGSYLDDPSVINNRIRIRTFPDERSPVIGFRCAADAGIE